MLTTILTLLGGSLGGILRFMPEVFKIFTAKADREHEYRMTQLQLDIDKARAGQAIDLVHAQGEMAQAAGEMQAYIEALKGQGKMSGVKWIDGLNQSVRPVIAYWWLLLFTVVKISTVIIAVEHNATLQSFVDSVWTPNDAGILSMILGFFYCDRTLRKMGHT